MPRVFYSTDSIKVIRPYGYKVPIGRYVLSGDERYIYERFFEDLNRHLTFLKRLDPHLSLPRLLRDILTVEGLKALKQKRPLELEHLRPRLNLTVLVERLNEKIWDRKIDGKYFCFFFMPADQPVISPFDLAVLGLSANEDTCDPFINDLTIDHHREKIYDLLLKDQDLNDKSSVPIFSEQQIYLALHQIFPGIKDEQIREYLQTQNNIFLQVLLPGDVPSSGRSFTLWVVPAGEALVPVVGAQDQPLIALFRGKEQETAACYTLKKIHYKTGRENLLRFFSNLKDPILVSTYKAFLKIGYESIYFTSEAFEQWKHQGLIKNIRSGNEYFITEEKVDNGSANRLLPSASKVFLDYIEHKNTYCEIRSWYLFLFRAIEVLSACPKNSAQYFEAARVAALHNASESSLAAIMLQNKIMDCGGKISSSNVPAFEYFAGWAPKELYLAFSTIAFRMGALSRVLQTDISQAKISSSEDFCGWFKDIIDNYENLLSRQKKLTPEFVSSEYGELFWLNPFLEYSSTVLGRLRLTEVYDLSPADLVNLKLLCLPLAERAGLQDIVDDIRDEILRITEPKRYRQFKKELTAVYGLDYLEMRAHLQDTVHFIEQVLAAVEISDKEYEIYFRVKTPYSLLEKLQYYSSLKGEAAWIKDILACNIVTADDALAYRVANLLHRAFLPLDEGSLNGDPFGLIGYLHSRRQAHSNDLIKSPRRGFSALTMVRATDLGLPLEIQVTSRKRHQDNVQGKSAHWRYKLQREVKNILHIELGPEFDKIG